MESEATDVLTIYIDYFLVLIVLPKMFVRQYLIFAVGLTTIIQQVLLFKNPQNHYLMVSCILE